jgi:hypothetical protein
MEDEIITWEKGSEVVDKMVQQLLTFVKAQETKRFHSDLYLETYSMVHRMCNQKAPYNFSDKLYAYHSAILKKYLSEQTIPALREKFDSSSLLEECSRQWEMFMRLNHWMKRIFLFLDRYHVKHSDLLSLEESGLKAFKTQVFDVISPEITKVMTKIIDSNGLLTPAKQKSLPICIDVDWNRISRSKDRMFKFVINPDGVIISFSHGNQMNVAFGTRQSESVESGDELLPSEYVHMLMRMLRDMETLDHLDLSEVNLSTNAIIHICQVVASLNRRMALRLGPWDFSNSEAIHAVCEIIRSGRSLKEFHLGCDYKAHPGLPVEILADALSSSLYLTEVSLCGKFDEYASAIEYVENLIRRIEYPNRLKSLECWFPNLKDYGSVSHIRLDDAKKALGAKLSRMQTKQAFVLIAMVYAVSTMKNKYDFKVRCHLSMLNVDVLRKLAVFV